MIDECTCGMPRGECICCGSECECHDSDTLVEVQKDVYTNTNGGSGPSEKLLKMMARKEIRKERPKIVQKKT